MCCLKLGKVKRCASLLLLCPFLPFLLFHHLLLLLLLLLLLSRLLRLLLLRMASMSAHSILIIIAHPVHPSGVALHPRHRNIPQQTKGSTLKPSATPNLSTTHAPVPDLVPYRPSSHAPRQAAAGQASIPPPPLLPLPPFVHLLQVFLL
jgi:hypothetical protein